MLLRVPRRVVRDLDEVATIVADSPIPVIVVFDVDNTLAPQGALVDEVGRLVNGAIDRFDAIESVSRVIVLSNGPARGVSRMIGRGNKPWTTRRRLGLQRQQNAIFVVGDQVLTDGVLAWRLRAEFLHLVIDDQSEAADQARMRRGGRRLERVLFRDGDGEGRRQ